MFSKSLAVGAFAAGCVAAAAGGAYVAVRQNPTAVPVEATAPVSQAPAPVGPQPVAETEAVVSSQPPSAAKAEKPSSLAAREEPPARRIVRPEKSERAPRASASSTRPVRAQTSERSEPSPDAQPVAREVASAPTPPQRETREPSDTSVQSPASTVPVELPAPPPETQYEELTIPASSVVGLRVETSVSTERARLEDRVQATVTRDVMADGRVAIPAGARAIGSVTLVERGGKVKERARLGVRFHTLVLANGTELPISTEAIYREGDSPSGESARKIGGAAVGGAILGALIGGKKGAIVGGATGAAGGTAVVMAGDRNAATLPSGTVVTIRLAAPVGVAVEKR
jgi:type IV secretory pathway VirB10-like protein